MAPEDVRSACESADYTDAEPEINCRTNALRFYLGRWSTKEGLLAAFQDELNNGDCAFLDRARGSFAVGGTRTGRGGGCAGAPYFDFANELSLIQGGIYLFEGTLDDVRHWFVRNRPTLPSRGEITGTALAPPIRELDWEDLVDRAERVAYREFFRNVDEYEAKLVYFRAQVLQVVPFEGALVLVTPGEFGLWQDPVYITYSSVDRVIDGDIVEFVGPAAGVYSYLTVAGAEKSVPQIDALELRIR